MLRAAWVPLALVALLALACSSSPDDETPALKGDTTPVDQPGPFGAGHRTIETTYDAPGGVGARTITVHFWYPTRDTSGENPVYQKLFTDPDVFEDASLAKTIYPDGYPVLVHSHGHRGYAGNSAELMRYFATHGWVAIAPEHVGNLLPDGDLKPPAIYYERPLDISASLDAAAALAAPDPLAGKLDLGHVLMSGHSFGTYTCWATAGATFDVAAIQAANDAQTDPAQKLTPDQLAVFSTKLSDDRVKAVIPMAGNGDPSWFGSGFDAVKLPMLQLTGGDNPVGGDAVYANLSPQVDFTWVDIAGGCHQLFGYGDCPNISNDVGFPIVNTYALAFGRYHVFGDRSELVSGIVLGTTPVSGLVTFKVK